MPFFSIQTNQDMSKEKTRETLKKASRFVSEMLGKPERYVMMSIEIDIAMLFGGTTEPAAFVQLKSIGLPVDRCAEFSERISGFLDDALGVPSDRAFIEFKNLERSMFGWNGGTF